MNYSYKDTGTVKLKYNKEVGVILCGAYEECDIRNTQPTYQNIR